MPSSRLFSYILIQDLTLSSISLKSAENITGLTVTLTAHGGARGPGRGAPGGESDETLALPLGGLGSPVSVTIAGVGEEWARSGPRAWGGAAAGPPAGDALLTDWRYTSVITRHAHYTEYTECFAH